MNCDALTLFMTTNDHRNRPLGNSKLFGNLNLRLAIRKILVNHNGCYRLWNLGARASGRWSVAAISPNPIADDVPNLGGVNVILCGQVCVTNPPVSGVTPANGFHLFPTQLGHAVRLASARIAAAFALAIVPVGFVVAKKQMIRAHARRIVAAVQDKLPGRNWTIGKKPRSSMSGNVIRLAAGVTIGADAAIPVLVSSEASPVPARSKGWKMPRRITAFVHLGPKALWKRGAQALCGQVGLSNFEVHTFSSFDCVTRSGVFANRRGTVLIHHIIASRKGERA